MIANCRGRGGARVPLLVAAQDGLHSCLVSTCLQVQRWTKRVISKERVMSGLTLQSTGLHAGGETHGTPAERHKEAHFDTSTYKLHSQGAEARVWEGHLLGRQVIVKQRFSKKYRHHLLDAKLTASRLRQEVRSMLRARKLGVRTPVVYLVDLGDSCIYMERIDGHTMKTLLRQQSLSEAGVEAALLAVGRLVAKLHDGGLVHGDLTTSNMMLRQQDQQLVLIDFGLSYTSTIPEDKAVDLYVLERAFSSAHVEAGAAMFERVLEAYRRSSKFWSATLNKFAEVRMRGRKRTMVG